ncbi:hypothetical protein OPHB3_2744 [Oceanobacillus picturae]|uniref:UPF0223 protein BN988_00832 n=1 Tax=Oceanobacillus picturae TaxID=171693 RepID=W9AI61_9BACI|nr:UPF0223 family protein [Oceanobacillus picturae]RIU96499.1 UPF0223 family protein [Oceanobacillus picturae]GAQ18788.1 hypothetical protein OPHB3_2744 [Oceanobacillus picturae]CDO02371.1 hypothetical protein BN988_00832 [Oceanobacillus picturae]
MNYQYPLDETWSKQEIIDVVNFFSLMEKAYESKVNKQNVLAVYNRLKEIIPSKSEEKKVFAAFEKESGYSSYKVVKKARETKEELFSMK